MLAGIEVRDRNLQMDPSELWACLQEALSNTFYPTFRGF